MKLNRGDYRGLMKKELYLLALIFTACVNLDNIGGNSGGEVKEVKTTNVSTSKNYERKMVACM